MQLTFITRSFHVHLRPCRTNANQCVSNLDPEYVQKCTANIPIIWGPVSIIIRLQVHCNQLQTFFNVQFWSIMIQYMSIIGLYYRQNEYLLDILKTDVDICNIHGVHTLDKLVFNVLYSELACIRFQPIFH